MNPPKSKGGGPGVAACDGSTLGETWKQFGCGDPWGNPRYPKTLYTFGVGFNKTKQHRNFYTHQTWKAHARAGLLQWNSAGLNIYNFRVFDIMLTWPPSPLHDEQT